MGASASSNRHSYPGRRAGSRNTTNSHHGNRANNSGSSGGPPTATRRYGDLNSGNSGGNSTTAPVVTSRLSSLPSASTISAPGAYSISRDSTGPTQVFRVAIPPNVRPNQEFQVYAGTRIVRVRCPPNLRSGQSIQITVPPDPVVTPQTARGMAQLTSSYDRPGGGAVRMNSRARNLNLQALTEEELLQQQQQQEQLRHQQERNNSNPDSNAPSAPRPQAYNVRVPEGVLPGTNFPVLVNGVQLMVQCPPNARPGTTVRIEPSPELLNAHNPTDRPSQSATGLDRPPEAPRPDQGTTGMSGLGNNFQTTNRMFEVVVPTGARPGQPFSLFAAGHRVLVTCPPNVRPGQRVQFSLPVTHNNSNSSSPGESIANNPYKLQEIEKVKLSYDTKDGWTRTIRITDMKFQWVRMDEQGDVDLDQRFDIRRSAYVRKLIFLQGNDDRLRTGRLSLVPAAQAAVASCVKDADNNKELVAYSEIARMQEQSFEKKASWFHTICKRLQIPWDEGHMRVNVRRDHLLGDSMEAVMSLSMQDLRKIWRFEFMGEAGIDAGGLAREWFQLITEEIFDADNGLWLSSSGNQMCMKINPASEISCPEDHLYYYRFLGRVMGKALFDGQLVAGHMVQHLYKHILGWPVTFEDLESVDEELYTNLKRMVALSKDEIEYLYLDFTVAEETLGVTKEIELIENGSNTDVTGDNLPEYLEANLKYRMLDRIRPQLTELLLGFFDVIPEPLLTIFDFQELELIMCGLPEIDMDDWKNNTLYSGSFERQKNHQVLKWFWEVVRDDFDQEMRARLLQFVTGTSGVPARGFSVLQGSDTNIRKFTIHGISLSAGVFPRSHTCFNRIDLPLYKKKEDLREKLKIAVTTSATGFTLE